ncbi:hypothetical protein B046DRAFT_00772 [Streptomyces sp. LamerLS-316]|nr:hypothetical protein B046DRAFT_00772 [Streptomyces sp. LamerLS-316]
MKSGGRPLTPGPGPFDGNAQAFPSYRSSQASSAA